MIIGHLALSALFMGYVMFAVQRRMPKRPQKKNALSEAASGMSADAVNDFIKSLKQFGKVSMKTFGPGCVKVKLFVVDTVEALRSIKKHN